MPIQVDLPEIRFTDGELPSSWEKPVDVENWRKRASLFDDLLVSALAEAIAADADVRAATGLAILRLTASIERIGDTLIQSSDAASFYLLTTHAPWRAAAKEFFQRSKLDAGAVLRSRPGTRLISSVALKRGAALAVMQ